MKTIFNWLLVAVCLFTVGNAQVMAETYLGNTFKIGRNVTNKKTQGDVIFNSGNVNIIGNSVELQSGAKVSKGAVLKIGNP